MGDFDRKHFTSSENEEWFHTRFDNSLVIEKTILPSIEEIFHLKEAFHVLQWQPVVELNGDFYPDLVRHFYANIANKANKHSRVIHTFVKGVHIELTEDYVADLLGVPNTRPRFS